MIKCVFLLTVPLVLSAQLSEYGGPSILSRGGPASSINPSADISFRPYLGLNAMYDTSFTGVVVNSDGTIPHKDFFGLQGSAGVYGSHRFKRSAIGLNYSGNYLHFPGNTYADSTDQMLTLEYDRQLTRRFSLVLTEAFGTYTRNYLYSSAGGMIDPQALILPTNDLFDNRVFYGQTVGGLIYRVSPRLSFRIGGSGFLVRRRSTSLLGVTGYTADVDAVYRLTRFISISALYGFNHFEFTQAFGSSDIHMVGTGVAARLSRSVELAVQAGAARVETLFLAPVPIDPAIAAITGQTTGIQAVHNVRYVPTARVRLTKQMRHATSELSYFQEVNPGNGLYLTSRNEGAYGSFSYNGKRRWTLSANLGYNKLHALAQGIGTYDGYVVGLGIGHDFRHGLQWTLRADDSRSVTNYKTLNRNAVRVTMGFYWSPGEIPLNLW
jgi:hypothetical protein